MVNPLYNAYNFYISFFNALPLSIRALVYLSISLTIIVSIVKAVNH